MFVELFVIHHVAVIAFVLRLVSESFFCCCFCYSLRLLIFVQIGKKPNNFV